MVMVISRFKVGNGMEQEVRDAFLHRPRLVNEAAGFLGMEVYTDVTDSSIFNLITRWTDLATFNAWHGSEAHGRSHKGIPAGLKLASGFTEVRRLERLPSGDGDLEELVADSIPLLTRLLAGSRAVHLIVADRDGTVRLCNSAFLQSLKLPESQTSGGSVWDLLTDADADSLRERIAGSRGGRKEQLLLNFVDVDRSPITLACLLEVQADYFVLLGEARGRDNETALIELLHLNNELAVMIRENARKSKELEQARAELAKTLADLQSSHWHLKKLQEVLPICMDCGKVKAAGQWEEVIKYLKANALFLSHGYCPDCLARVMSQYGLSSEGLEAPEEAKE